MNNFSFLDWREYRDHQKMIDMHWNSGDSWTSACESLYSETIENNYRWEQEFFEKREYAMNPYMKPVELPDDFEEASVDESWGGSIDDED